MAACKPGVGHRLEQVGNHAVLDGLVDQVGMPVGRDDDHGRSRILGDLPGRRQSVHAGHLDVEKDRVGKCSAAHLDGALAVIDHGHDVVAQGFKLILQSRGDWFLVVRDHKTIRPRHRRSPPSFVDVMRRSAIDSWQPADALDRPEAGMMHRNVDDSIFVSETFNSQSVRLTICPRPVKIRQSSPATRVPNVGFPQISIATSSKGSARRDPTLLDVLAFDDLAVGDEWESPGRTVTETDVVLFAGLSGDFNPLHCNHVSSEKGPFGRPVAHGLLGLAIASGLTQPCTQGRYLAFLAILEWRFLLPDRFGDTIKVVSRVEALEAQAQRPPRHRDLAPPDLEPGWSGRSRRPHPDPGPGQASAPAGQDRRRKTPPRTLMRLARCLPLDRTSLLHTVRPRLINALLWH